ncbi:MerR family transcriptional regulator [Paenibacillus albiflavus]|uniref:MerR family transcriptional regulator n=1 Tax=Paenibacillus albiflavus TaxID=2545760 RepID=A0A4R4EM66_9BACL|nr:MerR family transcriptional regulator [Paenibacillus albiflavus]TCZ80897.1 MerR family transcriptional regulator [Paenibacillus albiflavus]
MNEKRYTSGEIASAAGLTIRAVQHYDNIGLLPSSGRTEGGRRYYTQDDLIRLEQIVFYKSLDFSLDQIKEQLLLQPGTKELLEMFKNQQLLLLQRIEHLHTSFATIGIMSKMIEAGKEPPFHVLLRFLSALPGDDIFSHAPQMLTKEQQDLLSPHFQDIEPIQIFYHKWKEILIEATILHHDNISPNNPLAQDLARRWGETIVSFTGGNMELLKHLSELNLENRMIGQNEEMMESAKRYIENAFSIYSANNDLHLKTAD